MPTPTTEVGIALNAHRTHPREEEKKQIFFFLYICGYKEMQERKRKTIYKRGRIEITLKEHPGRADLQVPHYTPGGRSSREMALSAGH